MPYKPCQHCNKEFRYYPSRIKIGKGKYCSQRCWMDSKDRKEMMARIHKGKKCPFAKPPHLKGKDHWNWQGGITSESMKIRNSPEYKQWRMEVFLRDRFTCQICGQYGGKLHADHIQPFSKFPELRFDLNNGRTLCFECHKQTDTYLKNYVRNYQNAGH